jgi:hypothetical protein avisC_05923
VRVGGPFRILGGTLGVLLGWGAGSLIGGFADADRVDRSESAIGELSRRLPAGTAILAEVEEYAAEVLDDDVAPLGGQVLRLEAARVLTELGAVRVLHEERRQECKQKLGGPRRVPAREVLSQEARAATY